MGRAMIHAVVVFFAMALLLAAASSGELAKADASSTSHGGANASSLTVHRASTVAEHCYRHSAETSHNNRDDKLAWLVRGGVGMCVRSGEILSIRPMDACESPINAWTCKVKTRVLRLAGHPQQRRVLTIARLTPTPGSSTHSKTKVLCFHIGWKGGVRSLCRLTPSTVSSDDERCFVHTAKTYRFNREGIQTRWGNGGTKWCSMGGTMLSTTPIAHCGSPQGLWQCSAVTSITPLAGKPQQRRSFSLMTFHRIVSGVTHRKGMTQCFHFRTNGNVRSLCRINRS